MMDIETNMFGAPMLPLQPDFYWIRVGFMWYVAMEVDEFNFKIYPTGYVVKREYCKVGRKIELIEDDPTPEEVKRHDEYLARLREEDAKHIPDIGKKVKLTEGSI